MNRINIVCLGVKDIVASRAFYMKLGFTTPNMEDKPDVVFFQNGGTRLELFPLDNLAADVTSGTPPTPTTGFPGVTLAYNATTRQEVDDLLARIESIGWTISKMPVQASWGGYSGYFRDPDGYYWEVAYWDGWKFQEDGMLVIDDAVNIE